MAKDPLLRDAVKGDEAENPDGGRFRFAGGIADGTGLLRRGHGAGRSGIDRIGGRATVLEVEEMGDVVEMLDSIRSQKSRITRIRWKKRPSAPSLPPRTPLNPASTLQKTRR